MEKDNALAFYYILIEIRFCSLQIPLHLGNAGRRTDGKNLINEWLNNKNGDENRSYVWNKVRFSLYLCL